MTATQFVEMNSSTMKKRNIKPHTSDISLNKVTLMSSYGKKNKSIEAASKEIVNKSEEKATAETDKTEAQKALEDWDYN